MIDDLVEEIYAVRQKIWEECNRDPRVIVERLMRSQAEHPERLVTDVPKADAEPSAADAE